MSTAMDFRFLPFTSGDQVVWTQATGSEGFFKLETSNGTLVADLLGLDGVYTSAQFTAASDNNNGTVITVQEPANPGPPGGTTADMIMTDSIGDYEICDVGGKYNASLNAFVGNSMGAVGAPWVVDGIAGTDPPASGASTVSAFTAQLVQTMASMGGGAAVSAASGPTGGVELSQPTLLTTPHA